MSKARLRIGIDAHAVGERATGNERFIVNVARNLAARNEHDLFLYFTDRDAAAAWRRGGGEARVIRPGSGLLRIPIGLPIATRRDLIDVLLVQYIGPPFLRCPLVSVVHDVSFAVHPEYFSRSQRIWMPRAIPWTIRRAQRVVTVSRFSRDEICSRYGVTEDRVVVAYDGVDPIFARPASIASPFAAPFFLAVGNLQPRKNLGTLIRGFDLMRNRHPEVR